MEIAMVEGFREAEEGDHCVSNGGGVSPSENGEDARRGPAGPLLANIPYIRWFPAEGGTYIPHRPPRHQESFVPRLSAERRRRIIPLLSAS